MQKHHQVLIPETYKCYLRRKKDLCRYDQIKDLGLEIIWDYEGRPYFQ